MGIFNNETMQLGLCAIFMFVMACLSINSGLDILLTHCVGSEYKALIIEEKTTMFQKITKTYMWKYVKEHKFLFGITVGIQYINTLFLFLFFIGILGEFMASKDLYMFCDRSLRIAVVLAALSIGMASILALRWQRENEKINLEERTRKKEYYCQPKKTKWKLAPDSASDSFKDKQNRALDAASRMENAIGNVYQLVVERKMQPYKGMKEEMDDLFERLQQIEERLYAIGSKEDISLYSHDYWAFPTRYVNKFSKQQAIVTNNLKQKKKQLKKLCSIEGWVRYQWTRAYDKCEEISYYSTIQANNLSSTLCIMRDMVNEIKILAEEISDEKVLKWVAEQTEENIYFANLLKERQQKYQDDTSIV